MHRLSLIVRFGEPQVLSFILSHTTNGAGGAMLDAALRLDLPLLNKLSRPTLLAPIIGACRAHEDCPMNKMKCLLELYGLYLDYRLCIKLCIRLSISIVILVDMSQPLFLSSYRVVCRHSTEWIVSARVCGSKCVHLAQGC